MKYRKSGLIPSVIRPDLVFGKIKYEYALAIIYYAFATNLSTSSFSNLKVRLRLIFIRNHTVNFYAFVWDLKV